jgi:O-antigen/teichoic acid export membrane protein
MPGILMLSINVVYMNYFASTGMPMITVYSPAIAALANIVLNIKIIPLLGIIGASISSSICYSAMLGFSIFYIYKKDSCLMSTLKNQ